MKRPLLVSGLFVCVSDWEGMYEKEWRGIEMAID
jgi:hypothetical protein